MRQVTAVMAVVSLFVFVGSAWAEPICDTFWGEWYPNNMMIQGGGSGWGNGQWVSYPSGWSNQWFYNAPPDPERWKKITYDISFWTTGGSTELIDIAINWTVLTYNNPNNPPTNDPPIVREIVYQDIVTGDPAQTISGEIIIPDYNPEWVSIDVRTRPLDNMSNIWVEGTICHECIPEPATLSLLLIGGLALMRRRRR